MTEVRMTVANATAKINLALVVGPLRSDGKHELTTVYQRLALADRVSLEPADGLFVDGFPEDTIVARALESLAKAAGVEPRWRVALSKQIPVAAGLGGGSSDAAAALRLANQTLRAPLPVECLHRLAAMLGADVPFFLTAGPQLGTGDGTALAPLDLPQDYSVLLLLPHTVRKESTAAVYGAFDEREGATGYEERRRNLLEALANVRRPEDLTGLPRNDLASSKLGKRLEEAGAFRADVSGAGPAVYGLFLEAPDARAAARALAAEGRCLVTKPRWYG
jgi:4-diphosphocytidyl-2-C-methyl-D-erythritol kinase